MRVILVGIILITSLCVQGSNLMPCPDCGYEVSKRALMCPKCGCKGDVIESAAKKLDL